MAEQIGAISVAIIADQSRLNAGINQAVQTATNGGAKIASAFTAAVGPSTALNAAIERVTQATAALNSTQAQALAAIQPTTAGYAGAQITLQALQYQLQQAQAAFQQASQAAQANTAANQQQAASAQQSAAAMGQQTQAAMGVGAAMAAASAAAGNTTTTAQAMANAYYALGQQATGAGNAAGTSAMGSLRLYAALVLVRRALNELDKFRESEEHIRLFAMATGISEERIASFQNAISLAGGEGDKFGGVLQRVARAFESAEQGNKKMEDNLRRLHMTSKDAITAFMQLSETYSNLKPEAKFEALGLAEQVTGRTSAELMGILSQGPDVIRANMVAMQGLTDAQVKAIPEMHELTVSENQLKMAFAAVAIEAVPYLIYALKGLGSAFAVLKWGVQTNVDTVIAGFSAMVSAGQSAATVMVDLFSHNWAKAKVDAQVALTDMGTRLHTWVAQLNTDRKEADDLIDKLWNKAVGAPTKKPGTDSLDKPGDLKKPKASHEASDQMAEWRNQMEEIKSNGLINLEQQKSFWEQAEAIARNGVAKGGDLGKQWASVLRQVQQQILTIQGEEVASLKRATANEMKALEDRIKEAQEVAAEAGGEQPAAIKLKMLREAEPVSTPDVDTERQADIHRKILAAEREVRAEDKALKAKGVEELKKALAEEDAAWEESGHRTAADLEARYDYLRKRYADIQAIFDEYTKKHNPAVKAVSAEQLKVADIGASAEATHGEAGVQQQKIQLQAQYAMLVAKTWRDEISYATQLGVLEEKSLRIKLAGIEAEIKHANEAGDFPKAAAETAKWTAVNDSINTHNLETEEKIAKIRHDASLGPQIQKGLMGDIDSAAARFSQSIGQAVASGKGFGQVGTQAAKGLEASAISTVIGAAMKSALESSMIHSALVTLTGWIGKLLGGIMQSPQIVATTANSAALAVNTTALGVLTTAIGAEKAASAIKTGAGLLSGAAPAGASAAGGAASAASTASGSAMSAVTGMMGPILGGVISGVISGIFTLIGDAKIVAAIHGTTAAVNALRPAGGMGSSTAVQSTTGTPLGQPAPATAPSSQGSGIMGGLFTGLQEALGIGGGVPVRIVSVAATAMVSMGISGFLASLIGFAEGGRPPVGVPSIVGEKGMEMFIPDVAGTIIPSHQLVKAFSGGQPAIKEMMKQIYASKDTTTATMQVIRAMTAAPGSDGAMAQPFKMDAIMKPPKEATNLSAPSAPDSAFGPSRQSNEMAGSNQSVANNHTTGHIGDNNFNIYGARDPRETMRQIADYQKRQTGKFSPANS